MRTFPLIIVSAVLLVAPWGEAVSEPTAPNEIGLYTEPHGYGATGTSVIGSRVKVYLVLTRPTDPRTGQPFRTIWGYALNLVFDPVPGDDLILAKTSMPENCIDLGRYKDITQGILEYVVVWSDMQPVFGNVVDEADVLTEFTFMNFGLHTTAVRFLPVDVPGLFGQLVSIGYCGDGVPSENRDDYMFPVSGSIDAPVFMFNGEAVPVESRTFGTVKALYR